MDLRACRGRVHRLDDGREPQHEGHRDRQRDQQPGAHHRQHRPRRRGAVLDHRASAMRWARARRASRRSCPATGSSRTQQDREELAALWNVPVERIPATARSRVSGHHRSGAREEDSRAVDHRHESDRLVPEPEGAAAGARGSRVPRRAGRLSPDADVRVRAPDAAGRDVGREGRDLHQLRAAREQGQSRGRAARRSAARTSTSFSSSPACSACATRSSRAGPSRPTRSRNGSASPPAGSATTPASPTRRSSSTAACSGRFPPVPPTPARRGVSTPRAASAPTMAARDLIPVTVGAIPRAAERRVPVRAQHRPDGRALAHANQDGEGADPRAAVAARLGRDEPARRARAAPQAAGSRGRRSRGAAACAASSCA